MAFSGPGGKPTVEELRAASQGKSEDFGRFTNDATLQYWIDNYWDVGAGRFRSEHAPEGATGDWVYVDKPSESVTDPATGHEYGPWGDQSGVDLTAKGAAGAGDTAATAASTGQGEWGQGTDQALQDRLLSLFSDKGGYFDPANRAGMELAGGGMVWRDPLSQPADKSLPVAPRADRGAPPTGFITSTAPGASTPGVNPALVSATLNAFNPTAAPSVAGGVTGKGTAPLPQPAQAPTPAVQPVVPQPAPTPAVPPVSALTQSLTKRFPNPSKWWM